MTPAFDGWTEADYYRHSRAARAAWERTDDQLTLCTLEEGSGVDARGSAALDASPGSSSSAPSVASPPASGRSARLTGSSSPILPDATGSRFPHTQSEELRVPSQDAGSSGKEFPR